MTKELLEKYLNNRCTSEEVEELINWIKQQSFYVESKHLVESDWHNYKEEESIVVSDEKLDSLLDKIHHKINVEDPRTIQFRRRKLIRWMTNAAAVVLIPVLVFLFYTVSEKHKLTSHVASLSVDSLEVIAPIGSRTVVELSDGSVVHLNYGSRLKYPQSFFGDTRDVNLTGEGYFEVAHNPNKPFVVKTGSINVKAVGTIFNVDAYPENKDIATTLVEGKVFVEVKKGSSNIGNVKEMNPGQHLVYGKTTGTMNSTKENVEKYVAWKDGKLVFKNEPIEVIAQRLSRMFNVDIQVDDAAKKYNFTLTFIDEPLFQILDLLSVAAPISYKALPRTKNADGTFSKQKIKIEKKK